MFDPLQQMCLQGQRKQGSSVHQCTSIYLTHLRMMRTLPSSIDTRCTLPWRPVNAVRARHLGSSEGSPNIPLHSDAQRVMELLRQAVASELRAKPRPPNPELFIVSDRDATESWRRLLLRVFLTMRAAQWQATLLELTTLPPPTPFQEPSPDTSGRRGISKAELLGRPRLADSKSIKYVRENSEGCHHPEAIARGGKTFWWTCTWCRARWPRERGEYLVA